MPDSIVYLSAFILLSAIFERHPRQSFQAKFDTQVVMAPYLFCQLKNFFHWIMSLGGRPMNSGCGGALPPLSIFFKSKMAAKIDAQLQNRQYLEKYWI